MADAFGSLRAVPPAGDSPPRRRRPGPAVLLVLLYSALFGGGLWLLRAKISLWKPARGAALARPLSPSASPGSPKLSPSAERVALLTAAGVPAAERAAYLSELAARCCSCGCDLTIQACLERDPSCTRSPELAAEIRTAHR